MAEYSVATRFTAQDKVAKAFMNMSKQAKNFDDKATRAFRDSSRAASRFRDVVKGIMTAGAIQFGLGKAREGMVALTESYLDFEHSALAATVRFKDIGATSEAVANNLDRIKAAARAAGATTVFTATQGAQALDFFARAGWSSVEAIGVLTSAINLAISSGAEFNQAADWSSDLLMSLGMQSDDSAQKIKNYVRMNDVLVATVNSANVNLEQLFETLKVGGTIASYAGAQVEDLAAMAAVMASAGIKAERGGTTMKNMFTRLSAPTYEVWEGFKKLGIAQKDLIDQSGKMIPMVDVLALMGERMATLQQFEKVGVLKKVFGAWALAGAANLIKTVEGFKDFRDMLQEVQDVNRKTADIMEQSVISRLKLLKSAATEVGIELFDAFRPEIVSAIDSTTNAIRGIDMKPMIEEIRTFKADVEDLYRTIVSIKDNVARGYKSIIDDITLMVMSSGELLRRMFIDPIVFMISKLGIFTKYAEGIQERHKRPASAGILERREQRTAAEIHKAMQWQYSVKSAEGKSSLTIGFENAPAGMTATPGQGNNLDIDLESIGVMPM